MFAYRERKLNAYNDTLMENEENAFTIFHDSHV